MGFDADEVGYLHYCKRLGLGAGDLDRDRDRGQCHRRRLCAPVPAPRDLPPPATLADAVTPKSTCLWRRSFKPDEALSTIVRPARPADLDRLVELMLALQDHVESANPDLWRLKPEAQGRPEGPTGGRLTAANAYALVAEHDRDGVVGVIFGRIVTNNRYTPERAGLVDQAFVRADHRRAGVGSRLVAELCRFFAEAGVDDLSLRYVVGNEEAAGFWTALGLCAAHRHRRGGAAVCRRAPGSNRQG